MVINDIRKYTPKSMDNFFFDNNVWIYLFCPIGNHDQRKQQLYSSFLQKIRVVNATIWINGLILSEFCNTSIRLDYNLWKQQEQRNGQFATDFKENYRCTTRYKNTVESVNSAIKNIVYLCQKCSDNFNALDMSKILANTSEIDFNDSYYAELCRVSSFKLVTDDNDFSKLNTPINIIKG